MTRDTLSAAARDEYDLVVLGSGAAGLTAAIVAAAEGQRVLVLEHTDRIGGTTAISGGMVWIPANHKMAEAGIPDSAQAVQRYLDSTVPKLPGPSLLQTFVDRGDEAIRYLDRRTTVQLRPVKKYPDYYPKLPGATAGGRVLEAVPFDGSELGAQFPRLRAPLPEFMLFGGMMISREDIPQLRKMGRSPRAAWHVAKLVGRYALQRLRAPRGTTLYLGNALAGRLFKSAIDLGVEIRTGVVVRRLVLAGDRVAGVELADGVVTARAGVVLATGGISYDQELRRRYVPPAAGTLSATVDPGGAVSGVRLALEVGASLSEPERGGAFWFPCSRFTRADGTPAVYPHVVTDRAKPGLIAVDANGRRFVNEAVSYHEFVLAQLRAPATAIPAWLICDRRFLWKYGLGRVKPFTLSVGADVASGYLKRADTLAALAEAIGVPSTAFVETVTRFNADAREGVDREFGRGSDIYQQHLGDAEHQPNPCVAPIEAGPFYAVDVYPADLGMAAGLLTDAHARVLDPAGAPIPGLYACGNDMCSVMNGAYPGPGITIGPALTFGYLAARHAVANREASGTATPLRHGVAAG